MKDTVSFELNGETISCAATGASTLLDLLRDNARLTSARPGCRVGRCGACTVLLDGEAVPSCLVMVSQLSGRRVETVEGLRDDPDFQQVRDVLAQESALQCGYCTPGFAIALVSGIRDQRSGQEAELSESIAGNLCRCTGYGGLGRAIQSLKSRD